MYPLFFGGDGSRPMYELTDEDILAILATSNEDGHYYRPWKDPQTRNLPTCSFVKHEKERFLINMNLHHFKISEITVRAADGFLVVDAEHEERNDGYSLISRSFTRKYVIPNGVMEDCITSKMAKDGVLTIILPLHTPPVSDNERVVPIVTTGPVKIFSEDDD